MNNRYGYSVLSEQQRQEIIRNVTNYRAPPEYVEIPKPVPKQSFDIFSPQNFNEYIGQENQKQLVQIMIKAAKQEKRALPNILIVGAFGLGKTSLARLILKEFNNTDKMVDGASVNKNPLTPGLTIIDEIHNLEPPTCDSLNLALDRGTHQIIGCTTDPGKLPAAFRSRFRTLQLNTYTVDDLTKIAEFACNRKSVVIGPAVLPYIAKRSRSNARVLINNLAMIFDIMSVNNKKEINIDVANLAFDMAGIDSKGFLPRDRAYVQAMPNRPVGLSFLSAVLGIDSTTIQEEIEPYLLQCGIIDRTPKGRVKMREIS